MSEGNSDESQAKSNAKDAKPASNPLIHWLGAMVSVGVLAVMVYWGLQLVQRDPGEVPVIKAMEGPARVLPDDPGGAKSNYTGLAVNSVQSEGEAEKPSDRVVLAPAPRSLAAEDLPVAALETQAGSADKPDSGVIVNSVKATVNGDGYAEPGPDKVAALIELEDRQPDNGPITLTVRDVPDGMRVDASGAEVKIVKDDAAAPEPEDTTAIKVPAGTKYAPKTSLIPQAPTRRVLLTRAIKEASAERTQVKPLAREVPDAPLGSRLIQLGAYDSRDTALKEWVRISGKYHDLLGNKSFLVQPVKTGGRQFYRLRAVGFANSSESKSMCSALVQRGAQCIPVVAR